MSTTLSASRRSMARAAPGYLRNHPTEDADMNRGLLGTIVTVLVIIVLVIVILRLI